MDLNDQQRAYLESVRAAKKKPLEDPNLNDLQKDYLESVRQKKQIQEEPSNELSLLERGRATAHGYTKGWEDEGLAAVDTAGKVLTGNIPFKESYSNYLAKRKEEEENYERIKKKNPNAVLGHELVGGLFNPASYNAWLEGAITGAGESKSGLEDPRGLATETAKGAAIGGTLGRLIQKGAKYLGASPDEKLKSAAKRASLFAESQFDLPRREARRIFSDPDLLLGKETPPDVAKYIFENIPKKSKDALTEAGGTADTILRNHIGEIKKEPLVDIIDSMLDEIIKDYPKLLDKGAEKQYAHIMPVFQDLLDKKTFYGKYPTLPTDEARRLVKDLQQQGQFLENQAAFSKTPQSNTLQRKLNDYLKDISTPFKTQMETVNKPLGQLNERISKMGDSVDKIVPYVYDVGREAVRKPGRTNLFKNIDELLKENITKRSKDAYSREAIQQAVPAGSKHQVGVSNVLQGLTSLFKGGDNVQGAAKILSTFLANARQSYTREYGSRAVELASKIANKMARDPSEAEKYVSTILKNSAVDTRIAFEILERANEEKGIQ